MLIAVIAIACSVTLFSKWFADRTSQATTLERLRKTGRLCVEANYPLTSSILTQIQDLSDLKLAILSQDTMFESASSEFPMSIRKEDLDLMLRSRLTSTSQPLTMIQTTDGDRWYAIAMPLDAKSESKDRQRFAVVLESSDVLQRSNVQAFVLPLITGLCSLVAIAVTATYVAGRIGSRVEMLGQHVSRIANGSFESIPTTGPHDAIFSLYQSVNSMSVQLKQSTNQIAHNERARLINLLGSGLAHELRNRLTGARLAIQTCDRTAQESEALSIALKQMQLAEDSVKKLLAMRTSSNVESSAPLTIPQVLEAIQELTEPIANHQQVAFRVGAIKMESGVRAPEPMVADGQAVVSAIINLVLNAIEATGPAGQVELLTSVFPGPSGDVAQWTIRDSGPGPKAEIADKMFEPFATTKHEGVGLGLATSRQIARRHGGDLTWRRQGGFTEFVLRLVADASHPMS
jgi:signal transduction histidine kinase